MGKVFCYGCHKEFVRIGVHWAHNCLCYSQCLQQCRNVGASTPTADDRVGTLVGPQSLDGNDANPPSFDGDEIDGSDAEVVLSVRTSSHIHQPRLREEQTVASRRSPSAGGIIRLHDRSNGGVFHDDDGVSSLSSSSSKDSEWRHSTGTNNDEDASYDAVMRGAVARAKPFLTDADDAPGAKFHYPLERALADLPYLTRQESALVNLLKILDKAGAPLYTCNEVVSWVEMHNSVTFPVGWHLV